MLSHGERATLYHQSYEEIRSEAETTNMRARKYEVVFELLSDRGSAEAPTELLVRVAQAGSAVKGYRCMVLGAGWNPFSKKYRQMVNAGHRAHAELQTVERSVAKTTGLVNAAIQRRSVMQDEYNPPQAASDPAVGTAFHGVPGGHPVASYPPDPVPNRYSDGTDDESDYTILFWGSSFARILQEARAAGLPDPEPFPYNVPGFPPIFGESDDLDQEVIQADEEAESPTVESRDGSSHNRGLVLTALTSMSRPVFYNSSRIGVPMGAQTLVHTEME